MPRLIDADAYAADLWKLRVNYQMLDDTHTADKIMHGIFRAEQALKEQPTVAASPWHRVEEPPEYEGKYLVCDGRGNYHVAWWGQRLGWCYDPKFFCYWMPIEPPEGDA